MRSRPNVSSGTDVVAEEIAGAAVTDEVGSAAGMIAGGRATVFNGLDVFLGRRKGNVRVGTLDSPEPDDGTGWKGMCGRDV
jgi:hypothetical protein